MFAVNNAIDITWVLAATATSYANGFDLIVEDPDGVVTYSDTFAFSPNTLPTGSVDGELGTSYTPTKTGLYKFSLAYGTAGSYTIHSSKLVVVGTDASLKINVTLP
jgi:hypothetical protein